MRNTKNRRNGRFVPENIWNDVRNAVKAAKVYSTFYDLSYEAQVLKEWAMQNGKAQLVQEVERVRAEKADEISRKAISACRRLSDTYRGREREDCISAFWRCYNRESARGEEDGVKSAKLDTAGKVIKIRKEG